jgi:hypothetical protein
MKTKNRFLVLHILLTYIVISTFSSCVSFKNIGRDLGEGLEVDSLGFYLVKGMMESLTDEDSKKKLASLLDTLLVQTGTDLNLQVKNLRDSLLNEYVNKWVISVVEDAIGDSTKRRLGSLRDELLGDNTIRHILNLKRSVLDYELQRYVIELVSRLGPAFLNDSTLSDIGNARDTLLGEQSNTLIKSIVDTAMMTMANRISSDISPRLRGEVGFIQKNATWIIILIGAIALGITGYVWRKKEQYLRLTKLLTYQISEIPEQNVKETLKEDISKNAKTVGVEDQLREVLDKEGLLSMDKK